MVPWKLRRLRLLEHFGVVESHLTRRSTSSSNGCNWVHDVVAVLLNELPRVAHHTLILQVGSSGLLAIGLGVACEEFIVLLHLLPHLE